MVIYGNSLDNGTTKETIDIECNNKSTLDVSFSSKYMMDALKVIDSDNILIQLNSDDKPIIINDVEDDTIVDDFEDFTKMPVITSLLGYYDQDGTFVDYQVGDIVIFDDAHGYAYKITDLDP